MPKEGIRREQRFSVEQGCIDSVVSLRNMGSISNDSVSAIEGSMCVQVRIGKLQLPKAQQKTNLLLCSIAGSTDRRKDQFLSKSREKRLKGRTWKDQMALGRRRSSRYVKLIPTQGVRIGVRPLSAQVCGVVQGRDGIDWLDCYRNNRQYPLERSRTIRQPQIQNLLTQLALTHSLSCIRQDKTSQDLFEYCAGRDVHHCLGLKSISLFQPAPL